MRALSTHFFINDQPMLVPDEEVGCNYEDLDDSSSGRDESGVMHRTVVRYKVGSWSFSYSHLTEEEKQYMEKTYFPMRLPLCSNTPHGLMLPPRRKQSVIEVSIACPGKTPARACGAATASISLSAKEAALC